MKSHRETSTEIEPKEPCVGRFALSWQEGLGVRPKAKLPTVFAAALLTSIIALASVTGHAQTVDELRQRLEAIEQQMQQLKEQVAEAERKAQQAERKSANAARQVEADNDRPVKWHLSGYAQTGVEITDEAGRDDTFIAGTFNPVFHFQYKDIALFESELELAANSDGGTDVELEYASIDLLLHDNLTFVAGKFLSPVGQFQERLHPAWINRLPDAPAGFGHGGVAPRSEVGIMARGGVAFDPVTVNYALFGGNGPRVEFDDGELEGIELEGFGLDDNQNKAVGGRIGVLPLSYLEIGASFLTSKIDGDKEDGVAGDVSSGRFTLWGVDAAYTRGAWDVRAELVSANLGSFFSQHESGAASTEAVPETDWLAWYAQVAYKLSGLTDRPVLKNAELVGRYSDLDVDGFEHFIEHARPEHRWTLGLNYWFAPTLVGKVAVSLRDFSDGQSDDATEVRFQLGYGF